MVKNTIQLFKIQVHWVSETDILFLVLKSCNQIAVRN